VVGQQPRGAEVIEVERLRAGVGEVAREQRLAPPDVVGEAAPLAAGGLVDAQHLAVEVPQREIARRPGAEIDAPEPLVAGRVEEAPVPSGGRAPPHHRDRIPLVAPEVPGGEAAGVVVGAGGEVVVPGGGGQVAGAEGGGEVAGEVAEGIELHGLRVG